MYRKSTAFADAVLSGTGKNPVMVEAGKKAALTRASGSYTFDEHLDKIDKKMIHLVFDIQSFIMEIDDSIEEVPKKYYVAYKVTQNFVCMEVHKTEILLFLKIDAKDLETIPKNGRDVKETGHFGTGDFEYRIKSEKDFEEAKELILLAFKNISG